jgi:hypothetical protein
MLAFSSPMEAGDFTGDILRPYAPLADDMLVGEEKNQRANGDAR